MYAWKNQFTSPNKSILDDEVEDDESSTSSIMDKDNEFPNTSDIRIHASTAEESTEQLDSSPKKVSEIEELKSELLFLKAALEEKPRQTIVKNEDAFQEYKDISTTDEEEERKPKSTSYTNQNSKMVNVHMLDSENFVTEWNSFGPLPPPPDHDLHSPIVSELLDQWTYDKDTQKSLISWMEHVMNGADANCIQPLQISSLNHQIRDGFSMHILPILLRRYDIHVDVTTRAHRYTSYDMSIAVKSSKPSLNGVDNSNEDGTSMNISKVLNSNSPHMMAYKVSGGGNGMLNTSRRKEDVTQTIAKSSGNELSRAGKTSQHSIVAGALSAVGGLLNRRKSNDSEIHVQNEVKRDSHQNLPQNRKSTELSSSFSSSVANDEEQPYHRVVSAPPGKIGITFIGYRGHAMISDVYKNSPLLGWVFPSDILIAIDEVPVSGMRVPEIVKLLTARKERQRALRLISSHAMNELLITEDSGALMDG